MSELGRTSSAIAAGGEVSPEAGLLELLLRVPGAAVAVLDEQLNFARVNDAFAELGGIPAGEHTGRRLDDVVPAAASRLEPLLRRVLEADRPLYDVELPSATFVEHAAPRDIVVSCHPIETSASRAIAVVVSARPAHVNGDRGHLHARLLEEVGQAVIATDVQGTIIYWNRAAEQLYGWTAAEAAGRPIVEVTPALASRDDAERIMEIMRSGGRWEGEFDVRRRDGTDFRAWVTLAPVHDEQGRLSGLVGISTDISERKRTEAALRASESRLAASAIRSAALHTVTSALTRALTASEVAEVVLRVGVPALGAQRGSVAIVSSDAAALEVIGTVGYTPEVASQFRRFDLDERFPLADVVRSGEMILLETEAERDAHYPHLAELRMQNGGGAMAAVPLAVDGRLIGAIGLNYHEERRFTQEERAFLTAAAQQCAQALDRARLYEAERVARAEAERANHAKMQFLATMSHELRTPLNAIAGYAELLELGIHGAVTEEQRVALGRIRRGQRQLLSLINDVLNFAKIEAGRIEFELVPVSVHELLASVEALVLPQLRAKGHRFCYVPCDPALRVRADVEKVRQILLNLLSNAIKYTEPGGAITLASTVRHGEVVTSVRDSGRGIAPEKLERIFEPFVQVDRTLTSVHEGTGLGLAISRELARGMGGDLDAESTPGHGSTFRLRLPLDAASRHGD